MTPTERDLELLNSLGLDPETHVVEWKDDVTATETDEDDLADRKVNALMLEVMTAVADRHEKEYETAGAGVHTIGKAFDVLRHQTYIGNGNSKVAREFAIAVAAHAIWYVLSITDR